MGKPIIFIRFRLGYLATSEIKHMLLMGMKFLFILKKDLRETHRSYHFED